MKFNVLLVLSVLTLGLAGCEDLVPKEPLPSDPELISAENDLVTFTRNALTAVQPGSVFSVEVTAVAKEALELFAVSEVIPQGFIVIEGDITNFLVNVDAGEEITLNYLLKAGEQKGDFTLSGFTRAKPTGGESLKLELLSPMNVRD